MRIFGTDGIRGIANKDLTPELAFRAAQASVSVLGSESNRCVLIGRDTRYSGDMFEAALTAGFLSAGYDVYITGVIPTPAIAYLTRVKNFTLGVMISASHNPYEYNGIKFFNSKGLKLPDEIEDKIQAEIESTETILRPCGEKLGRVVDASELVSEYEKFLVDSVGVNLKGIKVAVDTGNGALYEIAPRVLESLGAEVYKINVAPDGKNINDCCGSTNPELIKKLVIETSSDIGFSFDGDADRIIAVDSKGNFMDGDHILAICAPYLSGVGALKNNTVVGTVMTNMGLDEYLSKCGIGIEKTKVGDRYILENMLENEYSIGGEQSGHIIFLDYNTTGDGMFTALMLLKIVKELNKTSSELNDTMKNYPQVLVNAKVKNELKYSYYENEIIKGEIEKLERFFNGTGRVLIRPSGTESLVRVMIESKNPEKLEEMAKNLADLIEKYLG